MKTSKEWIEHFRENAKELRVNWTIKPAISQIEISQILHSLQAWQLGETSDGTHLIRASVLYAKKINDPDYINAVKLFIKEEQKHGNNLGKYLDAINKPRIKQNWAILYSEKSGTLIPIWKYGHWLLLQLRVLPRYFTRL